MSSTFNAGGQRPRASLTSEVATRAKDIYEHIWMDGLVTSNDRLAIERGSTHGGHIYLPLERDTKVFECLQKRTLAQIARPWEVTIAEGESENEDIANLIAEMLGTHFDRLCAELMEALLTGISISEVVWRVDKNGHYAPDRFIQRDMRRFAFVENKQGRLEMRLVTREAPQLGERLPARRFISHRCGSRNDNPWGLGLGQQLFWPVYFKRRTMVAWNKFNDRFGTPTPWGQFPRNASAEEKQTLVNALASFSSDGYIASPEGTAITLLQTSGSGSVDTQRSLCEYLDDAIAGVVLGTEPRSKSGGAVAAASKERETVRLELVQADSDLICDTLNKTVLRWICELNNWPLHQVTRQIKSDIDRKSQAEADAVVASMGFKMTIEAVREKYGDGWEADERPRAMNPYAAQYLNPQQATDKPAEKDAEKPAEKASEKAGATSKQDKAADQAASKQNEAGENQSASQFAAGAARPDGYDREAVIEAISAAALDDWHPLEDGIELMLDELAAVVESGGDEAAIRARLSAALSQIDVEGLQKELHRSLMLARLVEAEHLAERDDG